METGARGIVICQCPVGEKLFCQASLEHKFTRICSVIENSCSTLLLKDKHAAYQALLFSYQARFDYYLSTNPPSLTDPLAEVVDTCLMGMLERIASVPLFQPAAPGTPFATLMRERVSLRNKDSGLGFRPISKRFLFLNCINLTMPQALDRKNKKGAIAPGIWNSLSRILGAHSFDEVNGATCWRFWQNSGSPLAAEAFGLIARAEPS